MNDAIPSLPRLSYHDLYVTTAKIPRTRMSSLPFGYQVTCDRVCGWELWFRDGSDMRTWENRAGEFALPSEWLVLDVNGVIIVDSRRDEDEEEADDE